MFCLNQKKTWRLWKSICWTVQKPNEPRYQKYWFSKKLQHFFWYSIFGTSVKHGNISQTDHNIHILLVCSFWYWYRCRLFHLMFRIFIKSCNSFQYYNDIEGKYLTEWSHNAYCIHVLKLCQWLLGQHPMTNYTGKNHGKMFYCSPNCPSFFPFKMGKNLLILREKKMDKFLGKY